MKKNAYKSNDLVILFVYIRFLEHYSKLHEDHYLLLLPIFLRFISNNLISFLSPYESLYLLSYSEVFKQFDISIHNSKIIKTKIT